MSLKRYDDLWRTKFGDGIKNSLKIRKVIDKLSDNDINVLAEFLENNDLEKISNI